MVTANDRFLRPKAPPSQPPQIIPAAQVLLWPSSICKESERKDKKKSQISFCWRVYRIWRNCYIRLDAKESDGLVWRHAQYRPAFQPNKLWVSAFTIAIRLGHRISFGLVTWCNRTVDYHKHEYIPQLLACRRKKEIFIAVVTIKTCQRV